MSIFQVFPTVLLHEILMHWISTKDLLHLDSALCNKIDRSEYLTILSTTFFRTQGLFLTQSTGLSAFQWLLKRQTRVTNLTVMDQRDIRNNDTDRYRDRDHYTFNTSNNGKILHSLPWMQMSFYFRDLEKIRYHIHHHRHRHHHGGWDTHLLLTSLQRIIVNSVDTLQYLDVSCNDMVNELFASKFTGKIANFSKLKTLRLSESNVNYSSLDRLLIRCPNLTTLDISSVMNLSNTMLQSIGQRCPSLRSLDLRGSKSVTDSGLLTIHKCKMLKEIDLSDCLQITSEAILALLVACPNLHSIALARIPQVTDDLLFGIARDAQLYDRLTKIDISECKHITDVGFVRLAFACSQLSNLTVNYCPLLTSVYLEKVKQECTQISLLSALHF
eukprot:gene10216-11308_t